MAGSHAGEEGVGDLDEAQELRLKLYAPRLGRDLVDRAGRGTTAVEDEYVHVTQGALCRVDDGRCRRRIGCVELQAVHGRTGSRRDLGCYRRGVCLLPTGQRDQRPFQQRLVDGREARKQRR